MGRGHTGASSLLAGAVAVVCSVVFVSLAGFWCVFFFVGATAAGFEVADFFAISFASSLAFDVLRTAGDPAHIPSMMAVPRCISVEPPTYTMQPLRAYDVTLGDKMVTDSMVALVYKAILEAVKNSGREGPRATQPGLAGFYLVLNKTAGQESKIVITVRGELSAAARTLNVGGVGGRRCCRRGRRRSAW